MSITLMQMSRLHGREAFDQSAAIALASIPLGQKAFKANHSSSMLSLA
jgi:hypothetical protein